jgi:hypothetical protein
MMPTRPLLSLLAAELHTWSSDTLYSEADQTLIRWCGASRLPRVGPLPQRTLAGDLIGTLSRTYSCPSVGGAVVALPHDVSHSE